MKTEEKGIPKRESRGKSRQPQADVKEVEEMKKMYELLHWLDPFMALRNSKTNADDLDDTTSPCFSEKYSDDEEDEEEDIENDTGYEKLMVTHR